MREDNFLNELLSHGLNFAFRAARFLGARAFKALFLKVGALLVSVLAPIVAPLLIVVLIFGFLYFSVFMLPKFITEGGGGPSTMEVVAAAYTAGYESTGKNPGDPGYGMTATGTKARRGTVAVDPEVIPFGTGMYIPGYGYGVAEDTGRAVKGNRVDLFFDDADEAREWGERTVTIRLFGKGRKSPAILAWGMGDTGWPFEKDEKLFERYLKLDHDWFNRFLGRQELMDQKVDEASGNAADGDATVGDVWGSYKEIAGEKAQVRPHRVHWALMASLDKMLGDSIVHGEHGPEELGKGRKPDPDKRFEELEPELEWKESELYYKHRWQVKVTDYDDDGNPVGYHCEWRSEEYKHKIRLLTFAKTYEADFAYTWKPKVIEREHRGDRPCSYSYTKVIIPELAGVEKQGPLYQRLKEILAGYGLYKDSNTEFVLQLAMNLDETFEVDAGTFGSPYEMAIPDVRFTGEPGEVNWPCPGSITSRFGYRIDPFTGQRRFHSGVDIAGAEGTPIGAAASGIVVAAGRAGGYGLWVVIDHGSFRTVYAHLKEILATTGREVKGGDVIGLMGSTGRSTGPHLHFEVRVNGACVDPEEFIANHPLLN
jgi:murein DD-endopeptidase MepM/ murein hydrolase activator NlpD/3D (Asp-Asp-Asp) domain-containing protein